MIFLLPIPSYHLLSYLILLISFLNQFFSFILILQDQPLNHNRFNQNYSICQDLYLLDCVLLNLLHFHLNKVKDQYHRFPHLPIHHLASPYQSLPFHYHLLHFTLHPINSIHLRIRFPFPCLLPIPNPLILILYHLILIIGHFSHQVTILQIQFHLLHFLSLGLHPFQFQVQFQSLSNFLISFINLYRLNFRKNL